MTQQSVNARPIILRAWEVRGILDGTVTQLWRAMEAGQYARSYHPYDGDLDDDGWPLACAVVSGCLTRVECPWGEAGDHVWGRETWRIDWTPAYGHGIRYAADERFISGNNPDQEGYQWLVAHYGGNNHTEPWRSSATIPRHFSRITLEIEQVSALAVCGISAPDALACGFGTLPCYACDEDGGWTCGEICEDCDGEGRISEIAHFRRQWHQDNPRHPWSSNPMAWRLVVRRVTT